jgi:2-(1,2-epoxy-1,2-dihydrophenyl)acetyl-CoA isomerase
MPTETNPSVAVRTAGAVRYIVLNRPGRYNAITVPMMRRLGDALDDAERDDAIRCIVLTATGPGFCTGQDLGVLAKQYEHQPVSSIADKLRDDYNPVVERIRALDKPIIAAVQGVAAGAGWSLALACDVRVAARSARFVPAFVRLGLVPGMGGSAALVEAVGVARALEYLLYRDELTADAALRFGLVSEVVEDGELAETVQRWATRVSGLPREGVARTKQLLRGMQEDAFRQQIDREVWLQRIATADPEHRARVMAWADRGKAGGGGYTV